MTAPPSRQDRRRGGRAARAVELRVDELALHGVAQADAAALTAAMSEELSRLAGQVGDVASLRAGQLVAPPYAPGTPAETGRAAAAALWAGVGHQGRSR